MLESGSSHAGAAWCGPRSKACGCRDRCRGRGRPATVPPPPPPLLYVLADDANRVLKVCDPAPASGYMCATCVTLVTRCTLLCAMPHAHHFSVRCDLQCRRGHSCRGSLTPPLPSHGRLRRSTSRVPRCLPPFMHHSRWRDCRAARAAAGSSARVARTCTLCAGVPSGSSAPSLMCVVLRPCPPGHVSWPLA